MYIAILHKNKRRTNGIIALYCDIKKGSDFIQKHLYIENILLRGNMKMILEGART